VADKCAATLFGQFPAIQADVTCGFVDVPMHPLAPASCIGSYANGQAGILDQ
jgi:hypothetical protein